MKRIFRFFLFIAILLMGIQESHATVLGANTSESPPTCPGFTDGWVTIDSLTTIPPSGPYVIRINTSPVRFFNVGDTVFGLTTQNYIITVLDLSDNSVAFTPVNFATSGINLAAFSNPASCFGVCDGDANVAVIGGAPPYLFQWDDPLNQTTQLATGLCARVYRVTVTDNNGCTVVDSTTVAEPPQIFPTVTVTNVSCFGFNDGSAVSNPTGGSGTYVNWAWSSSGNTTNTEGPLSPGPYSVTVTDSDGCTGVENFTVGQPGALNASFAVVDNDCFGGSTGTITTTVVGGTPAFNFAWDDGPITQNRTGLSAGTYTVTITDLNGCIEIDSAAVGQASEILFNMSVNSNNLCFGDSTGSVSASYSGGTPPYTFVWSEGSFGAGPASTINNLPAGTYTITVTDILGCTAEDSIAVVEPPAIQILVDNFANPACNGDLNGFIDLNVSGGTPALSFNWDPAGNTEDLFGIGAGTYTLTVTDGNGCTAVFDTTLVDPPLLTFVFDSIVNASCNGGNDGFLRVQSSGGTGAYSYNWAPAGNTQSISNLIAGVYTVTVSDANGCTAVDSATITEPAAINVPISSTDVSCFGDSNGTASITPSGGTPPYTFLWAPNGQTTQNITNLQAGTYTVTVTDINGCTGSNSTVVGQPPALTVNITGSDLNCFGDGSGIALANVLGGNPGYTFLWSDPLGQTTNPATFLAAGTYTVTVTDLIGCTVVDSVTLNEPPLLSFTLNTYDVSCGGVNDGAAAVNVSGGTPPYNYAWGPGNPTGQGTDSISSLTPGNYTLTITDNNTCDTTVNFTINQLPPTFTLSDSSVNPICNGGNTGFIGIRITGGTAPFNYNWVPALPNSPNQPNLSAGTYNVTVTDVTGCTNSTSVTLTDPPAIIVNDSIIDESCAPGGDGAIFLSVSGGTPGYSYTWNPALPNSPNQTGLSAGTYDVTITDLNGCNEIRSYNVNTLTASFTVSLVPLDVSCNGLSDGNILANTAPPGSNYRYNWSDIGLGSSLRTSLSAATYTVTVTDTITGCFVIDSATVSQPPAILSNLTLTPTGCAGAGTGSVVSNPSGGDGGPYTFNWNTPGGTIIGNTVTNLSAGQYTVTITDNSACTLVDTFQIISTPSNIDPNVVVDSASCNGVCDGRITLNPTNGVPPYTFLWNDAVTTQNRINLCAAIYTVTITGADNCDTTINITVGEPAAISATINTTVDTCAAGVGGARVNTISNGVPPFTYNWPPSGTAVGDSVNSLSAGSYNLTITDANGCQAVVPFTIGNFANFTVNLDSTDVSCSGGNDGTITSTLIGGTAPFNYTWTGGLTGANPINVLAGNYSVTVTDANGCGAIASVTVNQPPAFQLVNLITYPENCNPGNDGAARVFFNGGTPPYTYNWPAPGVAVGDSVNSLPAGNYVLTITDNNTCDTTINFTINSNPTYTVVVNSTDVSCSGLNDGTINVIVTGATPPITYNWSDIGNGPPNRTGLAPNTYDLTITDGTGCTANQSIPINEPGVLLANASATDESCTPGGDGTTSTAPTGGTPPYTYSWAPGGATTPGLTALTAGSYTVTVTDLNGCTDVDTVIVGGGGNIDPGATIDEPDCFGGCDGSITLSPSGGTAPYTYNWDDASTNFFRVSLCAGNYTVTITDAVACARIVTIPVGEPDSIQANAVVVNESCNPGGDGSITTAATGGTGPYTYSWSFGGATTPGISPLSAGTYTVTITDANNCTLIDSINVGTDPSFTISAVVNDESCPGLADGSIDQTIGGSFTTIVYAWDNGLPPTEDQINLSPGTYKVTVTDQGNGCLDSATYVINPSLNSIDPNLTTQDDDCGTFAVCLGFARSAPIGGTAPFTYTWTGPSTNITGVGIDSIGSLCPGNYTLLVVDANGCDTTINFTINPGSIITPNLLTTDETCLGQCNGTASVNPTGGVTPYTFNWSTTAGNVNSISGLCAGTYTVTITDAAACDTIVTFNIGTINTFNYTINSTDQSCNGGCDGTADVQIVGGTAGFGFNWAPAPGAGQGTNAVTGLCVGQYFVTITQTSSGCTAVDSVTIDPSSPIIPNEASVDESCAGSCDGIARVNPTGGNPPYTYTWTPTPPNNQQGNSEIRDLCAGNYSVLIEDASGCDTTINFVINPATAIVGNIVGEDQLCGNSIPCEGRAFVTPSGGTAPYTYNWTLGVVTGVSPDTAINLCNGQYFVTITDAIGCTTIDSVIINSPAPIDTSFSAINATCTNCDGSLKVSPIGGTAPYSYVWTDASSTQIGTTDSVGNLCAGIYFVEITDNLGCSATFARSISEDGSEALTTSSIDVSCFNGNDGEATVNFVCTDPTCSIAWFDGAGQPLNITTATAANLTAGTYFVEVTNGSGCISIEPVVVGQPNAITASISGTDASCSNSCDGTASVLISGGTTPYTFNWSPAPGSGQGTANVSGLCPAIYTVLVTDANGCDTTLSITIGSPSPITASFTFVDATCNQSDGSITATVSGGTVNLDYQYQWFDAANNPIVGQNSATINNIAAGAYTLEVRDDNNCLESFNVVLNSTNGPTISVDSITNLNCNGNNDGEIFISVSGSNPPFTFNWLNQGQTTEDISNLSAGTYTVLVTNALGCISGDTATVLAPAQILSTIIPQEANCGQCNGEARILVSGGTAPYTYLWSNGSTADTTANLCAGVHSVDVTDANGCVESFNFTINTLEGPSDAIISATNESCFGAGDGSATVTPVGGTPPYTYLWLHNSSTANSLSNLTAGTYFILITDAAGCSRNEEVMIGSPSELEITPTVIASSCAVSPCDGSIRLSVSGGSQPYSFNWQFAPAADTNFLDGLCAGIYEVTVTDANGCSKTLNVSLPNNGNPVLPNPIVSDASCNGSCDGSLLSNLTPGPTLTFRWLNENGVGIAPIDSNLSNSACAGVYILEVTSLPQGCISYARVEVEEPDSILLAPSIVNSISCDGDCDGEVFVSTTGGSILFTYVWDDPNAQTGVPATGLCAGTYSVTATDANGCTAITSVTLDNPAPLSLTINSQTILDCSSDCDASADVSASGGSAPYTFNWDGGQSGSNPNNLCFGPNIVTVTDATGCTEQITVNIAAIDTVVALVPSDTLFCEGEVVRLLGTVNGSTVNSIGWYEDDTTTLITSSTDTSLLLGIGDYTFFFIISNGSCFDTTAYNLSVVENPSVIVPAKIDIYKDEVATILIDGEDVSYNYSWAPAAGLNDSTLAEPTASIDEDRTYVLTVTDTNGCSFIDSVLVVYNDELNIPSGFTPNGDGKNDVWEIAVLEEFPDVKVQIFNRWGELLFEQDNGYKVPWDGTYEGKALPVGTYYFIIDLKSDRFETITGPVTILR